ncbi:MAG TPA: type II toxin-antitoxin system Phd/YefM family antitoxin [Thermodesulfobacteriota bacterium]|nr:type II toxin-antitoxin system Phd/YefM family antitoxin [Thermodesulfobacteriota bacterium]
MRTLSTVEARGNFSDLVNRSAYGKERVVLTRRGKGVAAVVPIEDLRLLEAIEDRLDLEDIERALANPKNKKAIPWNKVKKELGL